MKDLTIEIIQRCTKNCIYCSSNSTINCDKYIEFDVFKKIIDEAIYLGLEKVKLSGGEPLLHKDIFGMIKYCKSKNLHVTIFSSGVYKNKQSIPINIIKKMYKYGLDIIIFNLPSINNSIFKTISGAGIDVNVVLKSIKESSKLLNTAINFVPMKINYNGLIDICNFALKNHVKFVHLLALVNQGRATVYDNIINMSNLDNNNLNLIIEYINNNIDNSILKVGKSINMDKPCNAIDEKLVITFNGDVYPCESLQNIKEINGNKVGNIYNNSLSYIVENNIFLRQICKNGKKYGCKGCISKYYFRKDC